MNVLSLMGTLGIDTSAFEKGIDAAENKARSAGSSISAAFGNAQKALMPLAAIGGTVVAGLGAVAAAGLSFNNAMEQAKAKLNAFNKDANQTEADLAFINAEAAKTPFAFEEMVNAFAGLKPAAKAANMDVKDLLATAEVLAASNPAEGLEGAAFALREAAGGDFASAIERFNLPRQYINQLKEEGVPNIEIINRAMQSMGYDMDLVTAMAATAEGRWSTFTDTLKVMAGTVTQPIFDTFSAGLGTVNDMITANMPTIQALADTLAGKVATAITWLSDTAIPGLIAGWNQLQPTIQPIIDLIGANLEPILAGVAGTLAALVVPAIATAVAAFLSVAAPIAAMIAIGAALYSAWQNNFFGIQDVVRTVITSVQSIITTVMSAIQTFWTNNQDQIMAAANTAWQTIQTIIKTGTDIVKNTVIPAFTAIATFIAQHKDQIVGILEGMWTVLSNLFQGALTLISGILQTALALIKGDWNGAFAILKSTAESVMGNIKGIFDGAMTIIKNVITIALDAAKGAFESFKNTVTGIVEGVKTSITNKLNEVASFVEGLAGRFRSAGASLINSLRDGIMNTIGGLIADARAALQELTDLLPGSEPKDPTSPLRGLGNRGAALVENFQAGMNKASMSLDPLMNRVAAGLPSNTSNVNNSRTINVNMPTTASGAEVLDGLSTLQTLYG